MSVAIIGYILLAVGSIGSLICWIMTLIQMFKNEKPLIGILGVLCGLWAFIWGWMNATKLGLKKVMLIWTACFVVSIIGNVIATAGMMSHAKQLQEQGGMMPPTMPGMPLPSR